jgi:hypothetical protein
LGLLFSVYSVTPWRAPTNTASFGFNISQTILVSCKSSSFSGGMEVWFRSAFFQNQMASIGVRKQKAQ